MAKPVQRFADRDLPEEGQRLGFVPTRRTAGLLNYLLACPGARMKGYVLQRHGEVAGSLLLSEVNGKTRVADLQLGSDSAVDWHGAVLTASHAAAALPETCEIVAATSLEHMAAPLACVRISGVQSAARLRVGPSGSPARSAAPHHPGRLRRFFRLRPRLPVCHLSSNCRHWKRRAPRWPPAICRPPGRVLGEAVRGSQAPRLLRQADRLYTQMRKADPNHPFQRKIRLALVGTVTLNFLVPVLRAQCYASGIEAEFFVGGFGQYQQEILDPQSELARFQPEFVLILADWRSLGLDPETLPPPDLRAGWEALWRECRGRLQAFVIHCNFEAPVRDPFGRLSAASAGGRARIIRGLNLALWQAAEAQSGVAVLDLGPDRVAVRQGPVDRSRPLARRQTVPRGGRAAPIWPAHHSRVARAPRAFQKMPGGGSGWRALGRRHRGGWA